MKHAIKDYMPKEDELIAACRLYDPGWEDEKSDAQERTIKEAKRWLLVWGSVLPEMSRY
jgi:hypothetical protein